MSGYSKLCGGASVAGWDYGRWCSVSRSLPYEVPSPHPCRASCPCATSTCPLATIQWSTLSILIQHVRIFLFIHPQQSVLPMVLGAILASLFSPGQQNIFRPLCSYTTVSSSALRSICSLLVSRPLTTTNAGVHTSPSPICSVCHPPGSDSPTPNSVLKCLEQSRAQACCVVASMMGPFARPQAVSIR